MPGYLQVCSHLLYAVNNKVLENMIFMIIFVYILRIRHLSFGIANSVRLRLFFANKACFLHLRKYVGKLLSVLELIYHCTRTEKSRHLSQAL